MELCDVTRQMYEFVAVTKDGQCELPTKYTNSLNTARTQTVALVLCMQGL